MPADNDLDPVDRWLNQQVWPMAPPDGAFERITRRARRRKVRTAAISVASSAVVAVAVAVGATLGLAGGLGTSGPARVVIAGSRGTTPSGSSSQSEMGTGTADATPSGTGKASVQPTATGTSGSTVGLSCITTAGCLPGNFQPVTVTWVSQTVGYVMGQAGTPGKCGAQGTSDICTSLAITRDSGQTWAGVNAPVTGAASGLTGVSGLRFLDGINGWAYGPELWATHDSGRSWKQYKTNQQVTDLEAMNERAYALFATCTAANACSSYTLESTPAGQDAWAPVSGVPKNLTAPSTGSGQVAGVASIVIAASSGYLIAPDGSLYVGSLPQDGSPSTWQRASRVLPCKPSASLEGLYGQSLGVLLVPSWGGAAKPQKLSVVCEASTKQGFGSTVWISTDAGTTWTERTSVGNSGVSFIGKALSITATTDGTLIIATQEGIYRLTPGASQWQQSALSGSAAPPYGFNYVGMTTATQGVAIADSAAAPGQPAPDPNGIWMTLDGGKTWQFHKIQS